MAYKLGSPEEVIRRALIHAIDERESFLDSYSHTEDEEYLEVKERIKLELSDFYEMYRRRYKEKTPQEQSREKVKTVSLEEVLNKHK